MKKKALSQNSIAVLWNTARLAAYLLAIFLTPLIAKPIGILFDPVVSDWWQHGALRIFYTELITAFLWLGEIILFFFLDKKLQKKFNVQIDSVKPHASLSAVKENIPQAESVAQTEQTPSEEKTEEAKTASAPSEGKTDKPAPKSVAETKPKTELLGWDRMIAVFLICVACVLLISAQIGFQVKVFYELGERVILIDIVNFSGTAGRNIVKCGWIVLLIKCAFGIFEGLFQQTSIKPKAQKIYVYLCATALVLLFGVYDVLVPLNPFAWTYLLFYVAFVALYALVDRAPIKSYLLILFIYFF